MGLFLSLIVTGGHRDTPPMSPHPLREQKRTEKLQRFKGSDRNRSPYGELVSDFISTGRIFISRAIPPAAIPGISELAEPDSDQESPVGADQLQSDTNLQFCGVS